MEALASKICDAYSSGTITVWLMIRDRDLILEIIWNVRSVIVRSTYREKA